MTSSQRFRPERKMVAAPKKPDTLDRVRNNLQLIMPCRNAQVKSDTTHLNCQIYCIVSVD